MTSIKIIVASVILLVFFGCNDPLQDDHYKRPEWLQGKVYEQILADSTLSTFAKSVELTGYDDVINVSGSYTVFAPTNEAFQTFFADNPEYNSVENMPVEKLSEIVRYHIVQNPWSELQLRSLDVYGWIDTLDVSNDEPRGFKRETLYKPENRKYGVDFVQSGRESRSVIIDTTNAGLTRRVINSRKYAPIFFQEYLNIYDLEQSDYQFYFNRPFDGSSDMYFAGAKLVSDEIFAENGFVYKVDRVIEPLKTAYEILENSNGTESYTDFLDLVNFFPDFDYNQEETFDQPGADQGLAVDSLFDMQYPELVFDIHSESTTAPKGTFGLPQNVTIRYHHGMMAPTNSAFNNFINEYLKIPNGWGGVDQAPEHIKRIIAQTYMSQKPIYPTNFENGFLNGEQDKVVLDPSTIIEKQFGSNATFIGLNKAIVPRAFSSVTGPVYLQRGYSKVMYAIEKAGLLSALKRENQDYSLFVESDMKTSADSSLFYDSYNDMFYAYQIFEGADAELVPLTVDDIRTLILNHIALSTPTGIPAKEFIPNMAGNYIIFDNETGAVSGTAETTVGYRGLTAPPNYPKAINFEADNGTTFDIDNWFSFTASNLFTQLSSFYPEFHALLRKAGLTRDKEFRYTFISNNEFYTVFVPTAEAIEESNLHDLSVDELRKRLMLHFVKGDLIFTDGKKTAQYYETERISESSTRFATFFTNIYIEPGIDVIKIKGPGGENYVEVRESEKANRLAGVIMGDEQGAYQNSYNNAVIHEIDKVLSLENIDSN